MTNNNTINIFIAYSRTDTEYLDELRTHFTPLERTGEVNIWYDGKIEPGAIWESEIKEHLHGADLILLLVSASSIASDYFYDKEMKEALERHRLGTTKVVPFILRPCTWKATPLANLQVIPKDGKAVSTWNDRDEAYSDGVNSLWAMVSNMKQSNLKSIKAENETEEELRLKEEAETKRKAKKELRLKKESAAKKSAAEEQKKKEEADAKKKQEERQRLIEDTEVKRLQEERKVKEQTEDVKNIGSSGKGSDKITKEASQKKVNYKIPLIIASAIVVLAIVFWGVFIAKKNNANLADDSQTIIVKDSVEIQDWNNASRRNTLVDYDRYIEDYPKGAYISEAKVRINKILDNNHWDTAIGADTKEAYLEYLDTHPTGSHVGEANQKITDFNKHLSEEQQRQQRAMLEKTKREEEDAIKAAKNAEDKAWTTALTVNTADAYNDYLNKYLYGRYVNEANNKITALNAPSPKSVKNYMKSGTKLKAWNVRRVFFSHGSQNPLGYFIQKGGKSWVETSNDPTDERFFFEETNRDEWGVYLFDASRKVSLQLDMHGMQVFYADPKNPRRRQFSIEDYFEQ